MADERDALEDVYQKFLDKRRGITRVRKADVSHLHFFSPVTPWIPSDREGSFRMCFDMYGVRCMRRGGIKDPMMDWMDFLSIEAKQNGRGLGDLKQSPYDYGIRGQDTVIDLNACIFICFVYCLCSFEPLSFRFCFVFCFVFVSFLFLFYFVLFYFSERIFMIVIK